ncbi:MAG: DNA-binding protein [Actinomycetota bacterium]|nr:DNA-binding protein [Actinomycetota bacterium]
MAMTLRLSDEETEALRARSALEGRSMQEVAKTAIAAYVSDRPQRLVSAIEAVVIEDAELLRRLSQ